MEVVQTKDDRQEEAWWVREVHRANEDDRQE